MQEQEIIIMEWHVLLTSKEAYRWQLWKGKQINSEEDIERERERERERESNGVEYSTN